jgi:hypothetical protein
MNKFVEICIPVLIFGCFLLSFSMGIYEIFEAFKYGGLSHWMGGALLLISSSVSFIVIYLLVIL